MARSRTKPCAPRTRRGEAITGFSRGLRMRRRKACAHADSLLSRIAGGCASGRWTRLPRGGRVRAGSRVEAGIGAEAGGRCNYGRDVAETYASIFAGARQWLMRWASVFRIRTHQYVTHDRSRWKAHAGVRPAAERRPADTTPRATSDRTTRPFGTGSPDSGETVPHRVPRVPGAIAQRGTMVVSLSFAPGGAVRYFDGLTITWSMRTPSSRVCRRIVWTPVVAKVTVPGCRPPGGVLPAPGRHAAAGTRLPVHDDRARRADTQGRLAARHGSRGPAPTPSRSPCCCRPPTCGARCGTSPRQRR